MNNFNIILASNSQRRKELLKFIFNEFKVIPANIDERTLERKFLSKTTKDDKSKYSELCDILSLEKCKKVAKDYKSSLIVSADTIVYDDKYLFGKPNNYEEAKHMLEYLSGKEHIVQTSITIYFKDTFSTFSEKSYVTFYDLDIVQKNTIESYIKNENPYDKAGGYGIQDGASLLIKRINGDYFNIVGLPISKLNKKLLEIL